MKDPVTVPAQMAGVAMVSAVVYELFGVPLQTLTCALCGSMVGGTLARPTGVLSAIGLFVGATVLSALAGHAAAQQWLGGALWSGNLAAASIAVVFHPGLALVLTNLPVIFKAAMRKLGLEPAATTQEPPK